MRTCGQRRPKSSCAPLSACVQRWRELFVRVCVCVFSLSLLSTLPSLSLFISPHPLSLSLSLSLAAPNCGQPLRPGSTPHRRVVFCLGEGGAHLRVASHCLRQAVGTGHV